MALAEAQIVVQFSGGVETKQDHKSVLPARLLRLENAVFTRAISMVKRFGHTDLGARVLGSVAALPAARALGRRTSELVAFTRDEAYSYVAPAASWVRAGAVQSVICDHEPVAKTGSDQTLADMAVLGGIALYAWEDNRGGVWYAVLDDATGRALVAPTQVDASGERPRCHAVGEFLHLYWARAAANEIRIARIDPGVPTTTLVAAELITSAAGPYDIDTDDEKAVIAWGKTDHQIGVAYVHQQGVIGGLGLGLPIPVAIADDPHACLAVAIDKLDADRRVAVAWGEATQRYVVLGDDLAQEFAPRTIESFGETSRMTCVFLEDDGPAGDRELWVVYEKTGGAEPGPLRAVKVDASASFSLLAARTQLGLVLGGKAFLADGEAFVITQHDSSLYRTYFLQRISDGLAAARFLPGTAGGTIGRSHLPSVSESCFSAIYVTDVESPNGDVFTEKGIRRVSFAFDSPDAFRSVQMGRTLYIAGGLVQAYDGQRVTEAGFHVGPDDIEPPNVNAPVPSGPGIAEGTYGYVFVYENVLGNGEVERGPRSVAVLVEVVDSLSFVEFDIPTYRWPTKPGARIGVFRSLNGDASVFSRVSSLDPNTAGQVNGYVANDPDADTVPFRDEMPDEVLERQDPLYTNGGVVANDPIGAARLIAGGKGRLFAVDAAQPLRVYHSQEQEIDFAAEMSPELFLDVDPFGGDINGLIVMDSTAVVFKETAIFGFEGSGPAPNPELGGGFTQPEIITSDVGCVSPDSLVYTPVGVMFQSQKGIYQLGRDKTVRYVGAPVEAYNGQRVVAATLIEDRTQIRFLTDAGVTLLYDYLFDQWSTFTNHEGQDAVLVGGVYHYLRNDGQVWRETANLYQDNNTQIPMMLGTAHLKLAGHTQGFQRLWYAQFIGEYRSPHNVRIRAFYDYEAGHGDEWIFDPATFINLPGYGEGLYGAGAYSGGDEVSQRYEFEVHVGRQCAAVRFEIEFLEVVGDAGAAGEITEMILTGGVLRQRAVLTDERRA